MVELLSRVHAEGHLLVDGETVTFLWRGANPPQLIGDFNDWGRAARPLKLRVLAPGVWARKLTFPRDACMEYAFVRDKRRVLSQSGAFALEDPGSVIWDLVRDGNPRPIKIWLEILFPRLHYRTVF